MKANQSLRNVKRVERMVSKVFPLYEWEDIAMWMQTPKDFLFDQSPLQICATEDVEPLLKWLKERIVDRGFYYVTYKSSTHRGYSTGSLFISFNNPSTFNHQMATDYVRKLNPHYKDVVILNWKKLTKEESLLNCRYLYENQN